MQPVPPGGDKKMKGADEKSSRANFSIEMPRDATLYVQGQKIETNGSSPFQFVSPPLQAGARYVYEMKVVRERDGEQATQTQRVEMQAGRNVTVRFDELTVKTPTDRASVVVHLPKQAKLWVDETPFNEATAVRSFRTPKLETGEKYFYTMRAELEVDGKTHSDTKRVTVEAGKRVEVRFDELSQVLSVSSR